MSWENLPTNYTDAVFSGLRKYQQINNGDGTISFQDVTVYQNQENSFFGANDANKMNSAINQIMNNQPEPEDDIILLWEGSLSPGASIALLESAFNFVQLMILTSDGITLIGAPSPVASSNDFTAMATGPFAGAGAAVYGFSATILENGSKMNNSFCYAQEIGTSASTPITATAIYGFKRRVNAINPVMIHNNDSAAHKNMKADGNNTQSADTSSSLEEHIANSQAHQNLKIDGNES